MADSKSSRSFCLYSQLWTFIQQVAKQVYELTEYMAKNTESTRHLLKKLPAKWLTFLHYLLRLIMIINCSFHHVTGLVVKLFCCFISNSGTSEAGEVDSVVYYMLHYFFDGVMPVLQVQLPNDKYYRTVCKVKL